MKNMSSPSLRAALICAGLTLIVILAWLVMTGCHGMDLKVRTTMTEAREEAAALSSAWFQGVPDEWTGQGVKCFTVPDLFV